MKKKISYYYQKEKYFGRKEPNHFKNKFKSIQKSLLN